MRKFNYLLIFLLIFLTAACHSDSDTSEVETVATVQSGKVSGKVMSQNGAKAIGGASVFTFDSNYKIYHTTTNSEGNFTLTAPEGTHTIYIQTGNGSNFRTEVSANIQGNSTITLDATQTKLNQVAKIAYIKGNFDKIEDIIQNLGYTATEITNTDLANLNTLTQYDIVFLNCGSRKYSQFASLYPVIENNLAVFVANGGSVYASDWDVAYLLGGTDNTNNCNLAGGFIPDTKMCSKNYGVSGNVPGTVTNPALATALGFNTLNIDYDLANWQKITAYDANFWEVMVSETSTNAPLMVRTNQFTDNSLPNVPVGTTPNLNFVTVCVTLPSGVQLSISVPQPAVAPLLALGATLGFCSGAGNSGYIYYTTFHNHATGNIGNAAGILQYVIVNL